MRTDKSTLDYGFLVLEKILPYAPNLFVEAISQIQRTDRNCFKALIIFM